jgi:ribosomal 50S subunit-recycling heat shock protein
MRETGQFKPTALSFDPAPPENIVTTQAQNFSVITKAREYAKNLSVGGSVAVEAYGVEVSASVEVNKNTQFSSNSVTVRPLNLFTVAHRTAHSPWSQAEPQHRATFGSTCACRSSLAP